MVDAKQSSKSVQKRPKQRNAGTSTNTVMVRAAPAARATVVKRPVPSVVFSPNGDCTISHSEYVSDVTINTFFTSTNYDVDPQEATTFTWLSAIASRFEKSSFPKLEFSYKPSCSSTTNGYVIIAYDPDYYDSAPSKTSALSWRDSVKTAPWVAATVNASKTVSELGRRFHGPTVNGDQRVTNFGKLWVLSDQASAAQNVGELFVHYTVKFHIPAIKLPPAVYGVMYRPIDVPFVQESGNMKTSPGSHQAEWILHTAGSYYITVLVEWIGDCLTAALSFAAPATSLLTEWTSSAFGYVIDAAGRGIHTYLVTLTAGSLAIGMLTTGTGLYSNARIYVSTAKH
jgi:hypothetical protein